jgi:anti-sigma factor RsiW
MSDAWNDIMGKGREPDQQKLIDYLEGRLSPEERHEVERLFTESPFIDEAMEGLGMVGDKGKLPRITDELNAQLQQRLKKRKVAKEASPFRIPDRSLVLILTVTLLVLVMLAFVVYRMYTHR